MVFSSVIFLCIFLPFMIILYYLMPTDNIKNGFLLLGSLFFYAWGEPKYVLLMIVAITANYLFGLLIHGRREQGKKADLVLGIAVLFNLGVLFYFKYFNFMIDNLERVLPYSLGVKEVALPIGISFYTFQGMSYVIDVYREDLNAPDGVMVQKNYGKLALYISMFPQLIAGPIVRYGDIKSYLSNRKYSVNNFAEGAEHFIFGLAKKVIIADQLGMVATKIMENDLTMISATTAWVGAVCYMLQIFYDFAGYSEMAIGLGKIFGFEFMKNFDYPYISRSITEFWRRWHISLSQWFRDYLYIPMGGNRRGNVYLHLFIVFLATGIWHGAAWGFIVWGLWHGFFVLAERVIKKKFPGWHLPAPIGWLYTMFVVLMGWIVFRIVKLGDTLHYLKVMFGIYRSEFVRYGISYYLNGRIILIFVVAILLCIPWKELLTKYFLHLQGVETNEKILAVRRLAVLGLLMVCFLFVVNSTYSPFIYFRF